MIRLIKNLLFKKQVNIGVIASVFCIVFSSHLNAKENLVTSTGTHVRVQVKSNDGHYVNTYLTFKGLVVGKMIKGDSVIRLKIAREPQKTNYDIILNSKDSKLSFDDKSNNGGGGNSYRGWKIWLNKYDNSYGNIINLRKKLPKNEVQVLRAICGNLADTKNIKKYIGKNFANVYDPKKLLRNPDRIYKEFALIAKKCASGLKKVAPRSDDLSFVALKKPISTCKMSKLIIRRTQKVLRDLEMYTGQIDSKMGPGTVAGMKKGERKLSSIQGGSRYVQTNGCLSFNELSWLEALSEANKAGFQCSGRQLGFDDHQEFGPMLKDLGFLAQSHNFLGTSLSATKQRDLLTGIIKFEKSKYSSVSGSNKAAFPFVRDCYLSRGEKVELKEVWLNPNKKPINLNPSLQTLPANYTIEMAQFFISDLEKFIEKKGNLFGPDLVVKYSDVKSISDMGLWNVDTKNAFNQLKQFVLKQSSFSKFHEEEVKLRSNKRQLGLTRLKAALNYLLADGILYIGKFPLKREAVDVRKTIDEINAIKFRDDIPLFIEKINMVVQRFESLKVPFREVKFDTDNLFLTDELINVLEELRISNEAEEKRRRELADKRREAAKQEAKIAEANRIEEERQRKLKEEERKAKIKAENDKLRAYQKSAELFVEDIKEFVQTGGAFDISFPSYFQAVQGLGAAEWSDELILAYENLIAYTNKFDLFKVYRKDKTAKRLEKELKLRSDIKKDVLRVLKEIESWITGNPLAPEAADLLNILENFASQDTVDNIEILEKVLSDLIAGVGKLGVELPISELLDRRGYSLLGTNNPVAPVNVITTLRDAQLYIRDSKEFIQQNPTVFGSKIIVLYNNVRSIFDDNDWSTEAQSNFSAYEEFTSREATFVAFRKSALNARAKGEQLALKRLRTALVQLLADGTVYLQNNTLADNSLIVYEILEYGRAFERIINPKDLLAAIVKIKTEFSNNNVPFVDKMIATEFLEMSDEEIALVEKINEETKLRTEKIGELTDKIQKEASLEELALLEAEASKVESARIAAEEAQNKADEELTGIKTSPTATPATEFKSNLKKYRDEAQTLVDDAREYVKQGNTFPLEFVLLNAKVVDFEIAEWELPLFESYLKFRTFVFGFEEFKSFRDGQISLRVKLAEEKQLILLEEVKLATDALNNWLTKNQLDSRAPSAVQVYQNLINIIKEPLELLELENFEREIDLLSQAITDLQIDTLYLPKTSKRTTIPKGESIIVANPNTMTLNEAKLLVNDIQTYMKEGIGSFDTKLILLYGKVRPLETGVWAPSIEAAVLDLKEYVLSFKQFADYYEERINTRRQDEELEIRKLATETISHYEAIFVWLQNNPFDQNAADIVLKLQGYEQEIKALKEDLLHFDRVLLDEVYGNLSSISIKLGLNVSVTEKEISETSDVNVIGGKVGSPTLYPPKSFNVFVNLSGSAENAFKNINGDIEFENGEANYCYEMVKPFTKIEKFYANLEINRNRLPTFDQISQCSVESILETDILITDGLSINEGNKKVASALKAGFQEVLQLDQNYFAKSVMQDELISENLKTDILDGIRAGYGYIVMQNNSQIGCLTQEENILAHEYFLTASGNRVAMMRENPITSLQQMNLDNVFKQTQRQRCGLVYSNSENLEKLINGLDNFNIEYNLSPDWISPRKIKDKQIEIDNENEKATIDKSARQKELENQIKLETKALEKRLKDAKVKQAILRETRGPRVRGLVDEAKPNIMRIVDASFGLVSSKVSPQFVSAFPRLSQIVEYHFDRDWEEDKRQIDLVDYGTGRWLGRSVEIVELVLEIDIKNRSIGKYKNLCFNLMYVWDDEFKVVRDPFASECADVNNRRTWLMKQSFESLWNIVVE